MIVPQCLSNYLRRKVTGTTKRRIFFLHVPKCGGTTVHKAILGTFKVGQQLLANRQFHLNPDASLRASLLDGESLGSLRTKLLLYYMSIPKCRYISGHFQYSDAAVREFGREWTFLTLLREPVSRWFSLYFYNRFKQSHHFRITCDLEEFANSERGAAAGCSYVRMFVETPDQRSNFSEAVIQQAIANIDNFALVGLLERLDLFSRDFHDLFGSRLNLGRRNTSPVAKSEQQISERVRRRVEEICEPNRRIYEAVAKRVLAGEGIRTQAKSQAKAA
jgi:hypothetical protein